ncbi:cytochrome P450 [Planomonospora sp. ID82291]|uniref:cytochrome P450 n=1 Tax=Planomonospora sp. ID82291 TaxID=2738136 RepID=UPI0018C38F31|nr:cytochrome P450 [Planomonospora sp. ID82291]MBG0814048.1 cytochrome P450 [Planomonospora sp. ID82291]
MSDAAQFPFAPGPHQGPPTEYGRRHREEPLGPVEMPSGDRALLAVRYDDVATVLSDPRFSRELDYPGAPRFLPGFDIADAPGSIISMDPPRHTRLRRLLSGTFTPRQIGAWRPRVRAIAHRLVDGMLEQDGPVDFVSAFAFPLPVQVICDVMGVEDLDVARVREWSDAALSTSALTPDEQISAMIEFGAYIAELIAAHRLRPGDGLLTALIEAHDEGDKLDEEELIRITLGLFLAGHETTASVLSRALLRLLGPDGAYARLVASPELVAPAVEELLRMEEPGDVGLLRVATEDVELSCGRVRRGEAVMAPPCAANHDPAAFPEPDRFVIGRDGPGHLAFGRGAHYCLGANLARLELVEALAVLTERLPGLALAEPADAVPWTTGHIVRRPERLPVVPKG